MSPQALSARMETLRIILEKVEKDKEDVYKFLCREGTTPSQILVYTETFKELHKKEDKTSSEIAKIKKQLDVLAY